jgi:hypothetical protein
MTSIHSNIILDEVDLPHLDYAPLTQLHALPVVLLEDRLDVADGVEAVLFHLHRR